MGISLLVTTAWSILILVEIAHVHALLALERPLVDGMLFDVRLFKFLGRGELPSRRLRSRCGRDGARDAGSPRTRSHRTGTAVHALALRAEPALALGTCALLRAAVHALPLRARKAALALRPVGTIGRTPLSLRGTFPPGRAALRALLPGLRRTCLCLYGRGALLSLGSLRGGLFRPDGGSGRHGNGLFGNFGRGSGLRLGRLALCRLCLLGSARLLFPAARFLLRSLPADGSLPIAELLRYLAQLLLAARHRL